MSGVESHWPDERWRALLSIEYPIIQAPMAGAGGVALAAAVCRAGGLGSLPCAALDAASVSAQVAQVRQQSAGPINLNFFCHLSKAANKSELQIWQQRLALYYAQYNLVPNPVDGATARAPFDERMCEVVESTQPEVVSFHFGLPAQPLLQRVQDTGAKIISSATTVTEARWLEDHGCDAIIAQGYEAGGHRGMFLQTNITTQPGTFALLPQVVDAVTVPVIAAGGIADARGIAAAFVLGAAGVQIGTAYLFTPQALISPLHRQALQQATDDSTALTNVFSGKPARGIVNRLMREVGPIAEECPSFPSAGAALASLKQAAEAEGKTDFTSLWSGQAAALCKTEDATRLTRKLAEGALEHLGAVH